MINKIPPLFEYSRYKELIARFDSHQPERMLEIGVWKGDRAEMCLSLGRRLVEYVGFDLFDEMTDQCHESEGMGNCFAQPLDAVRSRLLEKKREHTTLRLVKGDTQVTLPAFLASSKVKYDFVFVDGGHSCDTIASDWRYVSQLLAVQGVCIFDDYYLETDAIGAKMLVDHLDTEVWARDFFQAITLTPEGHYVTMVAVSRRNNPT